MVLVAVIGRDGKVSGLAVREGHPLLVPAAFRAVCCWEFEPAKLGGEPVAIHFVIQVDFKLN